MPNNTIDDFPEIKTGNGKDRDLYATANDRLKKVAIRIDLLKETMIRLEKSSLKLQKAILLLAVIAVILAFIQVLHLF